MPRGRPVGLLGHDETILGEEAHIRHDKTFSRHYVYFASSINFGARLQQEGDLFGLDIIL
jgi:hypothetical protein